MGLTQWQKYLVLCVVKCLFVCESVCLIVYAFCILVSVVNVLNLFTIKHFKNLTIQCI